MSDLDLISAIMELTNQISEVRCNLARKEEKLRCLKLLKAQIDGTRVEEKLSKEEIVRYSRQMLVPCINTSGQYNLKKARVLVVGVGGLGCPCLLYLTSAGIGEISFIDDDHVEMSNLHRQVLHNESCIGIPKVLSAIVKLQWINTNIKLIPLQMQAKSASLSKLFNEKTFDLVIDGSDNVPTRYLLNDICVLNKIPLISGSALQLEGQLTVYNYNGGPCYRCLFPEPPPPETVTSCGDGGVLGPVPGMIGVLQALEAIKILTKQDGVLAGRLLTFDGSDTTFRNIRLRKRNTDCDVCGENPTITELIDYEQFCGGKADDKVHNISILNDEQHVQVKDVNFKGTLIDVRPQIEFDMCHVPESINIPYKTIQSEESMEEIKSLINSNEAQEVYVICRRGNDSQRAVALLSELFDKHPVKFLNVQGGLHAYSKTIDPSFPIY